MSFQQKRNRFSRCSLELNLLSLLDSYRMQWQVQLEPSTTFDVKTQSWQESFWKEFHFAMKFQIKMKEVKRQLRVESLIDVVRDEDGRAKESLIRYLMITKQQTFFLLLLLILLDILVIFQSIDGFGLEIIFKLIWLSSITWQTY